MNIRLRKKGVLSLILILSFIHYGWAQDDCASAVTITDLTGTICATSSPSTTDALAPGSCEEGDNDTWFTFTAQGNSATITVSNTANGWRPEFLVISSDDNTCTGGLIEENCVDQNGNYTSINATVNTLAAGDTYWIVVSSNNDNSSGTISVCVDNPAAPAACVDNQDCASPAALALNPSGGAATCVTDCNTGASIGPNFGGSGCEELPNSTVWYEITTDATAATLDITLNSTDLTNPEFSVFQTADCSNFTIFDCQEGAAGSASATGISIAPNTTYLIAVSDVNGNTGNFDLCVTQVAAPVGTCLGDDCLTPVPISLAVTGVQQCENGCNTLASVGPTFTGIGDCQELPNATVWYQVTTTANTFTMDVDVTSADLSDPEVTIFQTADCNTFTTVACAEGSGGAVSITGEQVNPGQTYLIAVSDATADEGNFQLCVEFGNNPSACNTNNSLTVVSTSLGSPAGGPYQPGEIVEFCYEINGWVTATTQCNYLQGIVPTFGDCWDPVSFDAQGQPTVTTPAQPPTSPPNPIATQGTFIVDLPPLSAFFAGDWNWYPAGSVDYNLPGPNNMGLTAGDDVGPGWYFTTIYQAHGGDPDNSYGDHDISNEPGFTGITCADAATTWQVCFQLQVKDATACGLGETDCGVSIKTYADGEIGVWNNQGCTADAPTTAPATVSCVLLSTDIESFLGQNAGEYNELEWTVSDASLVKEFIIEKSLDAVNWEPMTTVQGNDPQLSYRVEDQQPFNMVTYYRLKVVDPTENFTYSNVISISSNNNPNAGLVSDIYPNPTKDRFFFNYTGNNMDTPVNVEVVNMMGQVIEAYEVNLTDPNELFEVNTSRYTEGIYFVNITQGPLKMVKRISVIR
jgi:hypothetical protein